MKKSKKLIKKKVKDLDEIPFVYRTKQLGVAEFSFCFQYDKKVLTKAFIHRAQQENIEEYYEVDLNYSPTSFSITSWTHKNIDNPYIWVGCWCEEHKGICLRVYPPEGTNILQIEMSSNLTFRFIKGDE